MHLVLVNQSEVSMPKKWLQQFAEALDQQLKKQLKAKAPDKDLELSVVFLDSPAAKKLNQTYRKKNYPTDVLSFTSPDPESLGELVMCPQVLKAQAKEHGHGFKAELGYMLIHGVLHLLGYDHESSKQDAVVMFRIQDQIFDRLSAKFKI